ncbi:LysE family translocator [Roseateles sp. NT4]|uniref:LysE family translocator n=1 Tax=Roseateles sp. NT4 TaxID=3453715 RepID=UPI003F730D68
MIVVPGPATLLVATEGRSSVPAALKSVLGIVLGDVVLITLSGLGLAGLLLQFPALQNAIRVVGGLYLVWLSVGLLRHAGDRSATAGKQSTKGHIARGLLLTVTNPKPVLFFGSFFPLFLPRGDGAILLGFLQLGLVFELLNICYFSAVVFAVNKVGAGREVSANTRRYISTASGLGLLVCGVYVLLTVWS